jgi:hypothetical protein
MPETPYEALVLALTLALTAPSDDYADECAQLAEQIANAGGLTAKQVEDAQVEAAAAAEIWMSQE